MRTDELRAAYLDFFSERDHKVVPSSSLVPGDDPTVLFTVAGMVQFKDALTGREPAQHARVVSCQRCLRAGGKHNDLENVGYTGRHHTFFEMLGNFSFGDYYKEDAIAWAWEFTTRVLALPKERLWITVHPDDDESRALWVDKIGVDAQRVVPHPDNFWAMGETGPCGPNTELFYDLGPDVPGGPPGTADEDGDRYTEFWNLVFPQFDRARDGALAPLASPGVDTGMGLERMATVLQGRRSNYDNDLFRRLIGAVGQLDGVRAPAADDPAPRVIADHARAAVFLIADGVLPSNEERGYILRRIVRRALRHGYELGVRGPLFTPLVPVVVELLGDVYPVVRAKADAVADALSAEEERFADTLKSGMAVLERAIADLDGARVLAGELAFKLYDTHGFPLDMTRAIARDRGLGVDEQGFATAMAAQRERGRATAKFGAGDAPGVYTRRPVAFTGYAAAAGDGAVLALFRRDEAGALAAADTLPAGSRGVVVLDTTPFYAEAGGQIGDAGVIETTSADGQAAGAGVFEVVDTTRSGAQHLHHGRVRSGALRAGDRIRARIDSARRAAIARNHSATHLLHAALREELGDHVEQRGSLVAADRLRFDFSHPEPVGAEALRGVAAAVNARIHANTEVGVEEMAFDDAIRQGAVALFGEKYGDRVRVLTMANGYSVELCGGTHVQRTGDIGVLRIIGEEGVAAGVRRVEAVTGGRALAWVDERERELERVAELVKAGPGALVAKVGDLVAEAKGLRQELARLRAEAALGRSATLAAEAKDVGGLKVLAAEAPGDADQLLPLLDSLRDQLGNAVVVLAHVGERVRLVAGVTRRHSAGVDAAQLVRFVGAQVGARGGGRRDTAQAGGGDRPERLPEALASVADWVRERVSGSAGVPPAGGPGARVPSAR